MNHDPAWNPFRDLEALHQCLSGGFNRAPAARVVDEHGEPRRAEWLPPVDICEEDARYVLLAELPEVRREDLSVQTEHGVLTIAGERKPAAASRPRYHRVERSYGRFSRSFVLPEDSDPQRVKAVFRDGMLRIEIDKAAAAAPRSVQIEIDEGTPRTVVSPEGRDAGASPTD